LELSTFDGPSELDITEIIKEEEDDDDDEKKFEISKIQF
jgi:hypothetical protein